jgi:TonB family protein
MKMIKLLLGAALAGGLLSNVSLAAIDAPTALPQAPRADCPTVTKVVNPTGLPQRAAGTTVNVSFLVDQSGRPHYIRLVSASDPAVARSLIPALAQWRFHPRMKKGVPVATYVEMPIELAGGA